MGLIKRSLVTLPMAAWLSTVSPLVLTNGAFVEKTIPVADAPLTVDYYTDGSCLLTVGEVVQSGSTSIKADVDDMEARMLMHCDTENGRRLTLLARGDSLDAAERQELMTREEISNGDSGMTAWLTRAGVHYKDDSTPRRYVIAGSVKLHKTSAAETNGVVALHSQGRAFAQVSGLLEPIVKADGQNEVVPIPEAEPVADPVAEPQASDEEAQSLIRAQKQPLRSIQ